MSATIGVLVLAMGFVMQDKADTPVDKLQAIKQAEAKIAAELDKNTVFEFIAVPLTDVCKYVSELHGIKVELDAKAVKKAGITTNTLITTELEGMTLRSALNIMLHDLNLGHEIRDGVLLITPRAAKAPAVKQPAGAR